MVEVINELLGYEKIKIYQCPEMFSFSLDSMLLADFATILPNTKSIIDLCSGNAPIPLYLTLRTKAKIFGVEIQQKAFELGKKSVKINNMEEQITLLCDDVIGINLKLKQKYDLVLCNPPYFKYKEQSHVNKSLYKMIARHEVKIALDDILNEANKLLDNGGYFAMVHQPNRLVEILDTFTKYHIEPKRMQFVYPKEDKEANHLLIEGIKNGAKGNLRLLPPLIVYDSNHKWTKEIMAIYNKEGY